MNFKEAIEKLKEGKSIRRKGWEKYKHLTIMNTMKIKCFIQGAAPITFDQDVILSTDWVIVGDDKEMEFTEALEFVKKRFKIKLKNWPDTTYLELDQNGKDIFTRSLYESHYSPTFECFCATDWEVME